MFQGVMLDNFTKLPNIWLTPMIPFHCAQYVNRSSHYNIGEFKLDLYSILASQRPKTRNGFFLHMFRLLKELPSQHELTRRLHPALPRCQPTHNVPATFPQCNSNVKRTRCDSWKGGRCGARPAIVLPQTDCRYVLFQAD